ncbi:hypothetical protein [Sphingopyxis sp.]|uniref:hypothetical protein n=1 Tax=Sphingopyxis sp. TaxID=1908224 RepID=UPI0025EFB18A|nr:hypothetical protein [Sphingopyxis sp.]MBR2171750.1 hypothetical protein [Sphingopyxis sp.]
MVMGRPTRDPKGKRKQVAVRFGPQELSRLEELAAEAGEDVSVGKLIETRMGAMLSADTKTFDLLAALCAGIAEAEDVASSQQSDHTRAVWHQNLMGWATVAEMLAKGPIEDARPESVVNDPEYRDAQREKAEIVWKKRQVIKGLSTYGVSAAIEPALDRKGRGGLFGATLRYIDLRGPERAMIEAIPDDARRSAATELHNELVSLDEAEARETSAAGDTAKIFRDVEEMGRSLYRVHNTEKRIAYIKELAAGASRLAARARPE